MQRARANGGTPSKSPSWGCCKPLAAGNGPWPPLARLNPRPVRDPDSIGATGRRAQTDRSEAQGLPPEPRPWPAAQTPERAACRARRPPRIPRLTAEPPPTPAPAPPGPYARAGEGVGSAVGPADGLKAGPAGGPKMTGSSGSLLSLTRRAPLPELGSRHRPQRAALVAPRNRDRGPWRGQGKVWGHDGGYISPPAGASPSASVALGRRRR
jgi:hypothetical protein